MHCCNVPDLIDRAFWLLPVEVWVGTIFYDNLNAKPYFVIRSRKGREEVVNSEGLV